MRPVFKGEAPVVFTAHRQARDYLMARLGSFCSYCEMPVTNMIEVEHIIPVANGGDELNWDNFLLSCRYCNGIKSNRNQNRYGYLWPDRDNTDLAFEYRIDTIVKPKDDAVKAEAEATIDLTGLNRSPNSLPKSTPADMRPARRLYAYLKATQAKELYERNPTQEMAQAVALISQGFGFYSVWMMTFAGYPDVQQEIRSAFPGTYSVEDEAGVRVIRPDGII